MCHDEERARKEYDQEVWYEKRIERITEAMEEIVLDTLLTALENIRDRRDMLNQKRGSSEESVGCCQLRSDD